LAVKTTSGFKETGRSVAECRLTSNATVTVGKRDIWHKRLQKNVIKDKRCPTSAYAETGSRNMAESTKTKSQYRTSYSPLIGLQYGPIYHLLAAKTTSGLVDTGSDKGTPHRYLGFLKYPNFKGWKGQEGENASPCQISWRSVKLLLRFDDFSIIPRWRPPPCWICNACIWTPANAIWWSLALCKIWLESIQ